MITVEELKQGTLPKEFLDTLPSVCPYCGGKTEITETLTKLSCGNVKCTEKTTQRLVALFKDLGVLNMGEAKCRKFLQNFGVNNPYVIFMYEPDEDGVLFDGCSEDFSDQVFDDVDKTRSMLLWEYVKIGNLPGIRDEARKLFANYDDLEEFYETMEEDGVEFIQDLLGIKGKESNVIFGEEVVSVKAVKIYDTLTEFKDDLFLALDYVEIKQLTTPVINVCISTKVGSPYASKEDFKARMKEEFSHKVHINFLGSVTQDCHFLIWSKTGTPTTKVKNAWRINEKRAETGLDEMPICTGSEFRQYLLEY